MIAKVMVHASDRTTTIQKLGNVLSKSIICGPPTNLDFLHAILESRTFRAGHTLTNFLNNFKFSPSAIDVISPGVYTTVQDNPGRPTAGRGIPQAGPMVRIASIVTHRSFGLHRYLRIRWHFKVILRVVLFYYLNINSDLVCSQLQTFWPETLPIQKAWR